MSLAEEQKPTIGENQLRGARSEWYAQVGWADMMEEFEFRLRKVFAKCAVDHGLNINPERYQVRAVDEGAGKYLAESILLLATKEEEVFDYPDNRLTRLGQRWQTLKAKMPQWFLKRFPLKHTRIWAVSKFPDVNVPANYFGSEYVHFRVIADVENISNSAQD